VLCLIPARQGSKSIPHKNLAPFLGKPLLVHAVEQARRSRLVERTLVSTDSEEYAAVARDAGAEAPFLRPAALAGDLSPDIDVFQHALRWLADREGYRPDVCVHLRPTYPVRRPEEIDEAIGLLLAHPEADSVRSVTPSPHTPFKMWFQDEAGYLMPVISGDGSSQSLPRQALPAVYLQNACVDVIRTRTLEQGSMSGSRVLGYRMTHFFDIDDLQDLAAAAQTAVLQEDRPLRLCVDIDGILATLVTDLDYGNCRPNREAIDAINTLAAAGHRIILHTARGSQSGRDWKQSTEAQMRQWGVHYDEIVFGKPAADLYIDDKLVSAKTIISAARAVREKAAGVAQRDKRSV
jgi:CMP-N,N'-diacetyllegionaminic acid synthase